MKVRTLKKILSLKILGLSVIFYSIANATDIMSLENSLYWKRIEEAVLPCKVDTLFIEHDIPSNFGEFYRAKDACLRASYLLDQRKGEEAVRYLVFAERFYIANSLIYLAEISSGMYKGISDETRQIIKEKCSKILTTQQDMNELRSSYEQQTLDYVALLEEKCATSHLDFLGRYLKNGFSWLRRSVKGICYTSTRLPDKVSQTEPLLEEIPLVPLKEKKKL